MENELYMFLRETVRLRQDMVDSVFKLLNEAGVEDLESLFQCQIDDLLCFGLTRFQSIQIANRFPSNQQANRQQAMQNGNNHNQTQSQQLISMQNHQNGVQSSQRQNQTINESQFRSSNLFQNQNGQDVQMKDQEQIIQSSSANRFDSQTEYIEIIDTFSKPNQTTAILNQFNQQTRQQDFYLTIDNLMLFETYDDSSSEYKMTKIRLNESTFDQLFKAIKLQKVQVIGLYGNFERAIKLAQVFLSRQINVNHCDQEGILAFINQDKIALIFNTSEDLYNYRNQADSNNLVSTYLRYLIDVCQIIYLVPSLTFELNPELQNPYQDFINLGFQLSEQIIKPNNKVKIQEIEPVQDKVKYYDFKSLNTSFDNSKYFYTIDIDRQAKYDEINHLIEFKDIKPSSNSLYNTNKNFYGFQDVKNIILNEWPKQFQIFNNEFDQRKYEDLMIKVLSVFLKNEYQEDFKEIIKKKQNFILDAFKSNFIEIQQNQDRQLIEIYEEYLNYIEKVNCYNFREQGDQNSQNQGFFQKIISFVKFNPNTNKSCDSTCTNEAFTAFMNTYEHAYNSINWQQFQRVYNIRFGPKKICVHQSQKGNFVENLRELNKVSEKIKNLNNEEKKNSYSQLQRQISEQIFEECKNFFNIQKESFISTVSFQFHNISIIRDFSHQIQNWRINISPIQVSHRFGKESQGLIKVKNLYFITDQVGLVLFQNSPEGKSSIFYFNFGNKSQQNFYSLLQLASTESDLIIEPQLKQWFTYDNQLKRANFGKLTSQYKIDEGVPIAIYDQVCDGVLIEEIISASFIPHNDKIIFINQTKHLFEYRFQSKQLSLLFKKVNRDGQGVEKIKIQPNDNSEYDQIQATIDGKNIILKSKNFIDIYDLNLDKIYSFEISEDFLFFKTFTDKINNFIIISTKQQTQCYQIVGVSETKTLTSEIIGMQRDRILGNPIIDYIYQSFKKFGPHSEYIGSPSKTYINLIDTKGSMDFKRLQNYFDGLGLRNVEFNIYPISENIIDAHFQLIREQSYISSQKLRMILLGRVAIHVATVENFTLIPLQNGVNISDQITESLMQNKERTADLIEKLLDMIKFGIYEKTLLDIKTQIFVVSIVGRQSSGKSYVMNRIFGTRFNVAATRCTDGIWMSLVQIYDDNSSKIFVVLDCEGLFSARRNEQEEMKLCLALSAISDVMILNQDLSFNRYLNALFNNFTKAIGRIKGKKLFKSFLMMFIRDVRSEEAQQAYSELESNFIQRQGQESFLSAVFQGKLKSQCLNYFQQPIFDREIQMVRGKYFLSLDNLRWLNGQDFLDSFKITLAQVFSDDDTDMDIHKVKISCENVYNLSIQFFFNGGDIFDDYSGILYNQIHILRDKFSISVKLSEIKLLDENIDHYHTSEKPIFSQKLHDSFTVNSTQYYQAAHNDWIESYSQFLNNFFEQRKQIILTFFKEFAPKDPEFIEISKSYEFKLKENLEVYISKFLICQKTCRKCARKCILRINHQNNCDCETQHLCQEVCNKTATCIKNNYLCLEIYGHGNDHRCVEGNHKCSQYCSTGNNCKHLCQYESDHSDKIKHNCGNKHPCQKKCADSYCTRTCQFDQAFEHNEHICGETKCIHKCQFCDRQCNFNNHLHSLAIDSNNKDKLRMVIEGKPIELAYHICGQEHLCLDLCKEKGVCQVDYKIEERIWKNEFGEFPYPYFLPQENRNHCKLMIPPYMQQHQGNHNCKIGTHRCYHQCPECKSFCNQVVDHPDFHQTNSHRNKEKSIFVSSQGRDRISFIADGKKREYKVGESCQPENCNTSCSRKGRAHYHLKECPDIESCESKVNQFVEHSIDQYYPFPEKVYDKWLCTNYWNSFNWKPPISGVMLEEIQACNFVCGHSSHGDSLVFCKGTALHQDEHKFDCKHETCNSDLIDVVFCCDTTSSMSSYIKKSKNTINKIIERLIESSEDGSVKSLRFGFVAYRDHPPQDNSYVTLYLDLSDKEDTIEFISQITAGGGGDAPEAVLDGLYDSVFKMSWRQNSLRYIFHIADAPPHGKQYNSMTDGFPDGCPCNINIEIIAEKLKIENVKYKLLKIGSVVNTMASIFKSKIEDFEELELESASQMELKIPRLILRDIRTEEEDILIE